MRKSYIGITGITSKDDAEKLLETMPYSAHRLIMIGVLASFKTIQSLPNKWPNRYPRMSEIARIFPHHRLALNLIHYKAEPEHLYEQLVRITHIGGPNMHGLQLNTAWPSPRELHRYRTNFPFKQIVLQVGSHALEIVGHSPQRLALKIGEYAGLIDYALVDPSNGSGKTLGPILGPIQAREYLLAIKNRGLRIGLGIAGGLGPETIFLIKPLVDAMPNICIDAERLLRDQNDNLDLNLATNFIKESLQLLNGKCEAFV